MSLTPVQMRAARELLGWSRDRLGAMSGTSAHFVRHYEEYGRTIAPRTGTEDRLPGIRAALEAAGIIFVKDNGDGPGVRLWKAEQA